MIRYSTPTIEIETDIDNLQDFSEIWVSFKQNDVILRKTKEQIKIDGKNISVDLSQEETGAFKEKEPVEVQIRFLTSDGKAGGSNIEIIKFSKVLENEVIS